MSLSEDGEIWGSIFPSHGQESDRLSVSLRHLLVHTFPERGRRRTDFVPSARTTAALCRAIPHSQASLRVLARRDGINPKTVAKWRKRDWTADRQTGPTARFRGHLFDGRCTSPISLAVMHYDVDMCQKSDAGLNCG